MKNENLLKLLDSSDSSDPTELFRLLRHPNSLVCAHVYREIRTNIQTYLPSLHLIDLYVLKSMTLTQCPELEQVMMLVQVWVQYELPYSILYCILAFSLDSKEYISKICVGLLVECAIHHPRLKVSHHFISHLNLNWRISDVSSFILISLLESVESPHSLGVLPFITPLYDPESQEEKVNFENIINFLFLLLNTWHGLFYIKCNPSLWSLINETLLHGSDPTRVLILNLFKSFFLKKINHSIINYPTISDANISSEVLKALIHHKILESLTVVVNIPSLHELTSEVLFIIYEYAHDILVNVNLENVESIFKSATCFQPLSKHYNILKSLELSSLYPVHCQQLFVIDNSLKKTTINKLYYHQLFDMNKASHTVKGFSNSPMGILKSLNDAMCSNNTFNKPELWYFELINQCLLQLENELLFNEFVNSKYYKRLFLYFNISSNEFNSLGRDCNKSIVNTFNLLIQTSLNQESAFNNDFMNSFSLGLKGLIPSFTGGDNAFSNQNIDNTCIYYYISILQIFSNNPNGLIVLNQYNIFTILFQIIDHASNQSFILVLLEYFNFYNLHGKGLLNKLTTSTYEIIRLKALNHLSDIPKDYQIYGMQLLIEQLQDPIASIRYKATELLTTLLNTPTMINTFINYKPSIESIKINKQLVYTCLTTGDGFDYLQGFVDLELRLYTCLMNTRHVIEQDARSTSMLLNHHSEDVFSKCKFDKEMQIECDEGINVHFFNYACRTKTGYRHLSCSKEFEQMVQYIKKPIELLNYKESVILRGVIMAMGYMGMSLYGIMCLEDYNLISTMIDLAYSSENISVRGTCFTAISMIGTTEKGRERLEKLKWQCSMSKKHVLRMNNEPRAEFYKLNSESRTQQEEGLDDEVVEDILEVELINLLGDLSNNVIYTKQCNRIRQIKQTKGELFNRGNVILQLHKLLNHITYSTTAYRFIFSVFDLKIDLFELTSGTTTKLTKTMPRRIKKQTFDPDVDKTLIKRLQKRPDIDGPDGFHRD